MSFDIHVPRAPLNAYIECLWHTNLRVPYRSEFILPTNSIELIINFGDSFRLYTDLHADVLADQDNSYALMADSWLVGLQTGPLHNEPLGRTHMIGVRFKPGGTWAFLGGEAAATADRVVPLDALLGRDAASLRERLYDATTPAARFALLEHLLLQRLTSPHEHQDRLNHAIHRLHRTHGSLSIRHLSDEVGFSQKHLVSLFKNTIGLTPKTVARLCRLQHVLQSINPASPDPWAAVAQDAGYHDQAHFNRDFAAFTGMSPTLYLDRRRTVYGADLSQGDSVHFVPTG